MAESGYILVTIVFTVWCNYDALVSFAVVTIIFSMYLFNLYLNLLIDLCTWSHLLLQLLLSLLFLMLTLIKHIDWLEVELVLWIWLNWLLFYNFVSIIKHFSPTQSNPIQEYTPYLSVFSPNTGKCGPEEPRIRTIFTQWTLNSFGGPLLNYFVHLGGLHEVKR